MASPAPAPAPDPGLDWLRQGIPLSLLMDLAPETGPDSASIADSEIDKEELVAWIGQRP